MKGYVMSSLIVLVLAFSAVAEDSAGGREQSVEPVADVSTSQDTGGVQTRHLNLDSTGAACCGAAGAAQPANSDEESAKRPVSTHYCPKYVSFVMNGIYYHYCDNCNGSTGPSCTPGSASDTVPHDPQSCGTNCSPTCPHPIIVGGYPEKAANGERKLLKYAGPRRGDADNPGEPGDSDVSEGRLVRMGPGIEHGAGTDRVVKVRDGLGNLRYFRVFVIESRAHNLPPLTFKIGQQLANDELGFQEPLPGTMCPGKGDLWNHVIFIDAEPRIYYDVIAKDEIPKPECR